MWRQPPSNYRSAATVDDQSLCRYGGCFDSFASNYNPSAAFDDGSCVPYLWGCMDSNAINFIFNAERDDGGCLYRGCTKSFAYNFDPSANADDGSCLFNRASGKIATLGYMQNCLVHVDSNANLRIDAGEERNRAVPSDSIGYYSATYLTNANGNAGPVQAQRSAANGCVDSITGTPLSSPLRTHAMATTTPLTSRP